MKRAGLFRQAAEVSRRAIDGFPTFILALYQQAECLRQVGDFQKALEVVDTLLGHDDRPMPAKEWPQYLFHCDNEWWVGVETMRKKIVQGRDALQELWEID